jgi:hypothetical protein
MAVLYNVLWFAWEDGIAYRREVGKIWEGAWDSAETGEVDVWLGQRAYSNSTHSIQISA